MLSIVAGMEDMSAVLTALVIPVGAAAIVPRIIGMIVASMENGIII